jgi:hypothetical protein
LEFKQGNRVIRLTWTIKGLISEKDKVTKEFEAFKPDLVAMPISPEEMKGLRACVNGKVKTVALSNIEDAFAKRIGAWGKVTVPSPFLAQAWILAKKNKVPLKAVDLGEDEFTDFYLKAVSTPDLLIHSMKCRNLEKRRFNAQNPKDFCIEWDKVVSSTGGLRDVERLREETMARNILAIPEKHRRILAFIEVERYEGVKACIERELGKGRADMPGSNA